MTTCLATVRREPCPEPTTRTPLCDSHLAAASASVPLLVHDYRDLEQLLPKPIGQRLDEYHTFRPRSGPPSEASVPIQLNIEALQAEIWWLATVWAEVLADVQRLADPPMHVRRGHAVQWAVQLIAPRCEVLARIGEVELVTYPHADPEVAVRFRSVELIKIKGAQGLLDLASCHQRARSMLGLTEPTYVLPGRCQSRACGRAELRVKDGSDSVWCDHCRAVMTRDDYDRMGNLFLRPMEAA